MSLWKTSSAAAFVSCLALVALAPMPVSADHVVANWVYGVPTGELGHVTVHYVEVDKAAQGGPVRMYMGDGYVACLNGPIGYVSAPATQNGYIALEWRGCNPRDPVATFTYQLEGESVGDEEVVSPGYAHVTFDYDYRVPGAYVVDWRAGNAQAPAAGQSVIVAV